VQQAITPEAVALAIFGLIAAIAMALLVAQGLAQLAGRFAPDVGALRALPARGVHADALVLGAGLPLILVLVLGTLIAVAAVTSRPPAAPGRW
jgi:hypothetical protein